MTAFADPAEAAVAGRRVPAAQPAEPAKPAGWGQAARAALPVWVLSRLGVLLLTVAALWVLGSPGERSVSRWYGDWYRWDTQWYVTIAQHGYAPDPALLGLDRGRAAFFPLFPTLVRGVHTLGVPYLAAGLMISALAGAGALVLLWRLVALESGGVAADRAVRYLVLAPYSVFLAAAYTEALFLLLAVAAWTSARRRAWPAAWCLAGLAVLTRATGFALCAGLLVLFVADSVAGHPTARTRVRALLRWASLLPAVPLLAYAAFLVVLRRQTGRWDAFFDAEQVFSRGLTTPAVALSRTAAVVSLDTRPDVVYEFRFEVVAVVIALAVMLALLVQRRWAEGAFTAAATVMIVFGGVYNSGARLLLVLFPLWALLARAAARHRWIDTAVLTLGAPLSALMVVGFVRGQWVG